jgi:hypothetical protein
MEGPSVVYSCLLDMKPKFVYQLWVWLTMLLDEARVPPEDVCVHIVPRPDPEPAVEAYLRERGVAFRYVEPVLDGRFANRIALLESELLLARDYAVLSDTDVAMLARLDPWIGLGRFCAKEVDYPNPPVELLEALYRRAGFDGFPERKRCSFDERETFVTNCNGGVWIVRTELFGALSGPWKRWIAWVAEQGDLLGHYVLHKMQISFSLALWELGEPVVPLPKIANFPTHVELDRYDPHNDVPLALHYHDHIDEDGSIWEVGVPIVDRRIAVANARLARTPRPAVFEAALRAFLASNPQRTGHPDLVRQRRKLRSLRTATA